MSENAKFILIMGGTLLVLVAHIANDVLFPETEEERKKRLENCQHCGQKRPQFNLTPQA